MNSTVKENPQYKDRLFRMLFGSEEMKENIVSLYNALNNTNYSTDVELEITTLDDVIYIHMKNDVSLLINSYLSLWEQQSTFNPNMPLRGLMYFGNLYDAYIDKTQANIYGSTLIKIPTPQYVVFYNGKLNKEPVTKLRLSDSFINPDDSKGFEWTATMYNLNEGKNDNLLAKCKPLSDYMTLINCIREYEAGGLDVVKAVDKAVIKCIAEGVLKEFLQKHRAEVMDVCITEYNEKTFINGIHAEGVAEGRKAEVFESVRDGDYSVERGAQKLNISVDKFLKEMENAGYSIPEMV